MNKYGVEALNNIAGHKVHSICLKQSINGKDKIIIEFFGSYLTIKQSPIDGSLLIEKCFKGPIKLGNGVEPD